MTWCHLPSSVPFPGAEVPNERSSTPGLQLHFRKCLQLQQPNQGIPETQEGGGDGAAVPPPNLVILTWLPSLQSANEATVHQPESKCHVGRPGNGSRGAHCISPRMKMEMYHPLELGARLSLLHRPFMNKQQPHSITKMMDTRRAPIRSPLGAEQVSVFETGIERRYVRSSFQLCTQVALPDPQDLS